ncbi:hypothetical protein ColTof4_13537 [Colletotrichum tofieldiae]|uniref:Azaphilone pigments biosynthesis cluster protein L N-terminal domain-containing protein n=1 Tax=Colletotrichum tofieldiae TaxID=708197 RepID=A0A166NLX0_9PEZI|nr:hypothetical protein CT0861_02826 [Colletotrichum tofieldiae]GKT67147.1 hypothetical protein ColTof3_14486 [Colletotrichum tofieldiae]GKT81114.1 hypothetical protein ColTof4_13537 [Colletotrichum tofieldiae]GKT97368.1 hypothetical protein Ct61P_15218 [Colletotrichum tofieldiae]
MADPLSITSSVLAVAAAAIASTRVLNETLSLLKNHDSTLQRLQCELNDLAVVLNNLEDMLQRDVSSMTPLKGPISRCSQLCLDFDKSMNELTGKAKIRSRDWAKLKLRRDDIHELIDKLSGYRSTIAVGLGAINLHGSSATPHVLKEYNEMIESTEHGLNLCLQRINAKIAGLPQKISNDPDTTIDWNHERAVLEGCLHICEDAGTNHASWMKQKTILHSEEPSEQARDQHEHFEVQKPIRQTLSKNKDRIAEMVGHLQSRLDSLPLDRSHAHDDERTRLHQEVDILTQQLDVYNVTFDEGVWENENVAREITTSVHSDEVIFTTLMELIGFKQASYTRSSANILGSMIDETLDRLSESRYSSRFEALPSTHTTIRRWLDDNQHRKGDGPSQKVNNDQQMMAESPGAPSPHEVRRRTMDSLARVGEDADPLIVQTTPSQSEAASSLWDHAYGGLHDGDPQPANQHVEVTSTELAKHGT